MFGTYLLRDMYTECNSDYDCVLLGLSFFWVFFLGPAGVL